MVENQAIYAHIMIPVNWYRDDSLWFRDTIMVSQDELIATIFERCVNHLQTKYQGILNEYQVNMNQYHMNQYIHTDGYNTILLPVQVDEAKYWAKLQAVHQFDFVLTKRPVLNQNQNQNRQQVNQNPNQIQVNECCVIL